MRFRIKYADRIVGLFILVAGLSLVGIVALAGGHQRWFAKDARYETLLDSAAIASPGAAILMRGFPVGKIRDVRLDGRNQVRAEFVIYEEYRELVRLGSIIEIVISPIGLGNQILFHPGRGEGTIAEGSVIPEARSEEGQRLIELELVEVPKKDDTITRLLSGVNPLIENTGKTVVSLNKTLTELNKAIAGEGDTPLAGIVTGAAGAMRGVNGLVGNANSTVTSLKGEVDGVFTDLDGVFARLDQLSADLGVITGNFAELSEGLKDPRGLVMTLVEPKGSIATLLNDDGELMGRIDGILGGLEGTVATLSSMTASLNGQLPGIAATVLELKNVAKDAQDVLVGLKNNPLLRGGIPEQKQQPAVFQSLREGLY